MTNTAQKFLFGEDWLTAGKALQIATANLDGIISSDFRKRVRDSQKAVEHIVDKGQPVYGINTGFGPLCTTKISKEETKILQTNILQSHSVGVGKPIDNQIAKLMLILKLHALAKGYSGIAETTLDRILWHINNDAIPVVPSQGSVGASGDLGSPLTFISTTNWYGESELQRQSD